MDKRKLMMGAGAIVLVAAAAWAFGRLDGTDPAVAELQQMAGQMFDRDLPEAQRDGLRDEFRERMRSLSDDQRRAFFDASRDQWMGRAEQRFDEFFAMPPADQQKQLDEILNRMTQPRPERSGGRGGEGRDWGGRGGNMSEAQRDERSKRRLDRTSPKVRAQFTEFRRRLDQRAKERGINLDTAPGRGFPGGRRGA